MKDQPLTFLRILAIAFILLCSTAAWVILGSTLLVRSDSTDRALGASVDQIWGRALTQRPLEAWYLSPTGAHGRRILPATATDAQVRLDYQPKAKGLLWYRTYSVAFTATYRITNPTPIPQTIYARFRLPEGGGEFEGVSFRLGDRDVTSPPVEGALSEAVTVPAGGSVSAVVAYTTRGRDQWTYDLGGAERVRDFRLVMETNFSEIDFPSIGSSPSARQPRDDDGWTLRWQYQDVVNPRPVSIAMPGVLNAGPVAARISFFAPVSLVFFFAVLLILGAVRGVSLHPMNFFFLAAGCFAFQLLFAYLVDLLPVHASFAVAAAVSLLLVGGYLHLVGGRRLSAVAVPAQFAYMVLFSYSFFFEGVSGLVITIGAVVTLAILMAASARVDWSAKFRRRPVPVPGV